MVAGLIVGSAISARLAHRWPIEQTVKAALAIMALGAVLNVMQSLWLVTMISTSVIPLVLYACGTGMAIPAMTVMSLDCFPHNRGAASAMQGFVQMMANTLVASFAVALLSTQASHFALGQLMLFLIALILWSRLPTASLQKT